LKSIENKVSRNQHIRPATAVRPAYLSRTSRDKNLAYISCLV
jgi:hypothetical protein